MQTDVVSQETRDQLVAAGFRVASRSFREAWRWAARDGAEYSVDLEAGLYVRWGEPYRERPLAELVAVTLRRDEARPATSLTTAILPAASFVTAERDGYETDEQDPFVRECLAAGFTPDPERWQTSFGPPLTTRANFVRWTDGTLWLAHSSRRLTAKGMGQPPATRELQDFVPRSTSVSTTTRDGYKQRSLFE